MLPPSSAFRERDAAALGASSAPSRLPRGLQLCCGEPSQSSSQEGDLGTVRRHADLHQLSGTGRASWRMLKEMLEQINYLVVGFFSLIES